MVQFSVTFAMSEADFDKHKQNAYKAAVAKAAGNGVLFSDIDLIRVIFPSFADGRGFSLARHLRLLGFNGRLRAFGPVLADQYTMARRAGFDEVEIPDALAQRQSQDQWQARSDWRAHDYQSRLRQFDGL